MSVGGKVGTISEGAATELIAALMSEARSEDGSDEHEGASGTVTIEEEAQQPAGGASHEEAKRAWLAKLDRELTHRASWGGVGPR